MNQFGSKNNQAMQQYRSLGMRTAIEDATPHRLIQMLMDGALDKIAAARGFMERGEIAQKGAHISWAISIIDGLRVSLDKSVGGEIAQNLEDLYNYMMVRLAEANLKNDAAYLNEVSGLLRQIKEGWDAIPQEIIRDHAAGKGSPQSGQAYGQ
ncbi:MAG: flagellar export chaperone FliS [Gammaproteobacteria bacterium]|nr:flagellar export chaperone FliS [Gammaproteobacteria bacterium]